MFASAPASSLKERQRQERERLILQAAEDLLLEKGYHETSIDDIAARVGISKGTVYLHFATKEDLVVALVEQGMRSFLHALDETLSSPASPREKLHAIITQFYGTHAGRSFGLRNRLFESPELLGRLAERRQAKSALWEEPMRRICALLDAGKAAGEFDPALPTPVMRALLIGMLSPHGYQRLIEDDHLPHEEVVEYLCRFFFKGIAPDAACATPQRRAENGDQSR